MGNENYYHMFANGDDAKDFITSEDEFRVAFNRFALCQYLSGAKVLSFSVEDTHPHALLFGDYEECFKFKTMYESLTLRSIWRRRGTKTGTVLHCELLEIDDVKYL